MKLPHYLDNQTLIMNTHNSFNRKTAPRKLNMNTTPLVHEHTVSDSLNLHDLMVFYAGCYLFIFDEYL